MTQCLTRGYGDGYDAAETDVQIAATTARIGGAAVVHLQGAVDLASCDRAEDVLRTAADGAAALVVDLDGVEFFSLAGLNLLMRLRGELAAGGAELRVVASRRHLLRPFELIGLGDALPLHKSTQEALAQEALAQEALAQGALAAKPRRREQG